MSEFTNKEKKRVKDLTNYILGLLAEKNGNNLLTQYQILETKFTPLEILQAIENVFHSETDMEKLKTVSNKLFNILYEHLSNYKKPDYPKKSIINFLIKDNNELKKQLTKTKLKIKQINNEIASETLNLLKKDFQQIQEYTEHYTVMQNIVFSEIEKQIKEHQCLKIMWSFHDDIILNIKKTIKSLQKKDFNLKEFNKTIGKIYFNINTIIFREENLLFPIIFDFLPEESQANMLSQLKGFHLAFVDTSTINLKTTNALLDNKDKNQNIIKLSTGELTLKQLELIFSHLPVDITFVDEKDEVRYFSSPKDRIFPRTTGIIGRKIQNCHPQESVDIVNKIVDAFKKGKKNDASFWIKISDKYVLIKYFAVRDKNENYKGILEVSQEISDIQKISGEKRLLDW